MLLFPTLVFAQDVAFRYFISFNNNANTDYSINTPEKYLSLKTIAKRQKYSITIDSTDLPISVQYRYVMLRLLLLNFYLYSSWFDGK